MKPKLYQDVDGCLLLEFPVQGYLTCQRGGRTFWYAPETPQRLQVIEKLYDFIWASHTWQGYEEFLASLFGLHPWPSLSFMSVDHHTPDMRIEKLHAIDQDMGGDPGIIVDDRMGDTVQKWAADKDVILIQPNKLLGVTRPEFGLLLSFGEMMNSTVGENLIARVCTRKRQKSFEESQHPRDENGRFSDGSGVPVSVQGTIFARGLHPEEYHAHAVKMIGDLDAAHNGDPTWQENVAAVKSAMSGFPMIHTAQLGNIEDIEKTGLRPAHEFGAGLQFDKISGLDRTVFMRMGQAGGGGHGAVGVMVDPSKLDQDKFIVTKLGAMDLKNEEDAFLKTPGDHSALVDSQLQQYRELTIGYRDLADVQSRLLVHGYEKDHPGTFGTRISPEKIVANDHGEMEVKYAGEIKPDAQIAYFAGDKPLPEFDGKSAYDYLKGRVPDSKLVKYHGESLKELSAAYRSHYASRTKDFDESQHPRDDHGRFSDGGGTALMHDSPSGTSGMMNAAVQKITKGLEDAQLCRQMRIGDDRAFYVNESGTMIAGDDVRIIAKAVSARDIGKLMESKCSAGDASDLADMLGEPQMYSGQSPHERAAFGLIDLWQKTSGDGNGYAVAVQERAAQVFGLKNAWVPTFRPELSHDAYSQSEFDSAKAKMLAHSSTVDAFLRSTYDNTQSQLKAAGIENVALYRGMKFSDSDQEWKALSGAAHASSVGGTSGVVDDLKLTTQPISSYSADLQKAFEFGRSTGSKSMGVLTGTVVPRERIFAIPSSGGSCLNESEILVLGGDSGKSRAFLTGTETVNPFPHNNKYAAERFWQ